MDRASRPARRRHADASPRCTRRHRELPHTSTLMGFVDPRRFRVTRATTSTGRAGSKTTRSRSLCRPAPSPLRCASGAPWRPGPAGISAPMSRLFRTPGSAAKTSSRRSDSGTGRWHRQRPAGLPGSLEDPARHRHRHPNCVVRGGQLADERVHHFRQVGLREVGGRAARDLVLLLQQPVPATQVA